MGTHDATGVAAGSLEPSEAGLPRLEGRVLHIIEYEASLFGSTRRFWGECGFGLACCRYKNGDIQMVVICPWVLQGGSGHTVLGRGMHEKLRFYQPSSVLVRVALVVVPICVDFNNNDRYILVVL